MIITFLGTSSAAPTKERNPNSIAFEFEGNISLIDVSEGAQRMLMQKKISYLKIRNIFFTHLHGDHLFGLPGLIGTMAMHKRQEPLYIFGPKGVKETLSKIMELGFQQFGVSFEIICKEVKEGLVLKEKNFEVKAVKLNHSVSCYGYIFEESVLPKFNKQKALDLKIPEGPLFKELQEGKNVKVNGKVIKANQVLDFDKTRLPRKISFIFDTLANQSYVSAIKESDILIHESNFSNEFKDRAIETKHSTAEMAGLIASKAKVETLVLTHFSPRHKELDKLENEARKHFGEVICAEDGMQLLLDKNKKLEIEK